MTRISSLKPRRIEHDIFLAAQLQPTSTPLAAEITLSQQVRRSSRRFGVALGWIVTGRSGSPILWHTGEPAALGPSPGSTPNAEPRSFRSPAPDESRAGRPTSSLTPLNAHATSD